MTIVNILTQKHLNNNYYIFRNQYNELYLKYIQNTCKCVMYSPYIKNGTCRFCQKNEKKTHQDILKIILKTLK